MNHEIGDPYAMSYCSHRLIIRYPLLQYYPAIPQSDPKKASLRLSCALFWDRGGIEGVLYKSMM